MTTKKTMLIILKEDIIQERNVDKIIGVYYYTQEMY
jgi:hypothetical protein